MADDRTQDNRTEPQETVFGAAQHGSEPGHASLAAASPDALRVLVHDLRNVIAPIRNAIQLLRLRSESDSTIYTIADLIERQVNELVRMANELGTTAVSPPSINSEGGPVTAGAGAVRKILIADDNEALRTSLSTFLREGGHDVRTAADGVEAVEAGRQWAPQFVLLDINMPNMNGFEAARQLRTLFAPSAMRLILMSGNVLDETIVRGAQRAGFDHCIDKIHDLAVLERLLEDLSAP